MVAVLHSIIERCIALDVSCMGSFRKGHDKGIKRIIPDCFQTGRFIVVANQFHLL